MKKILPILCVFLLLSSLLTGCALSEMSSLGELTRPYEGEYNCETLCIGEEELLARFDYVRLTLKNGDAQLRWRSVEGGEGAVSMQYEMREDSVTFSKNGRMGAYTFPVHEGTIVISYNLGGRLLLARFRM